MSPYAQLLYDVSVNAVSSVGQRDQPTEDTIGELEFKNWRLRLPAQVATRSKGNPKETCIILEFTEVRQLCQVDCNGEAPSIVSPAFYSDNYEHLLGIRMYPCGLGEGRNRFVAVFVHMMSGKYGNIHPRWPFTPRITIFILDQGGNERHISQIIQAKPNMVAFQKPTEEISRTGCGLVKFAPIEEVFGAPYVKDDKLFLKVEFSF
ncbi:TNF receptor-associated factor 3-like [Stylophora pistillata]|uniref:TNF receptor-associated factor 3-like n=1 Tax=Stylophora pistillata TaxID=50429 RepID=UPI000C04E0E3|nr:TNF receptor-associated factor 3-like [Stylophora pistillata]